MAAGDRSSRAAVNVLGVSSYGRFSGVHLWPVLGVHRGPGYGCSTHLPGRTLLDWPDDVVACAYKIPDRLTRSAVVGGAGPLLSRRVGAFLLPLFPRVAAAAIETFANPRDDPEAFLERGSAGLPAADREILEDPEIRAMLIESYRESARHGVSGFVRDLYTVLAQRVPIGVW